MKNPVEFAEQVLGIELHPLQKEALMGMAGCFIYAPITILVWLKLAGQLSISQNT